MASALDLFKKIGDPVAKGEPLYRIHAAFEAGFRFSTRSAADGNGFSIGGIP